MNELNTELKFSLNQLTSGMPVDRCICHNISFEEIKMKADNLQISTIEKLQELNICSTGCKICRPYISEMLRTGETSFQPGSLCRKTRNSR